MQLILQMLQGFIIIISIIILVIYVIQALLLSGLNKLIYGKGTILAWIPICNTYLLGKLTCNSIVGILLVLFNFFVSFSTSAMFVNNSSGLGIVPILYLIYNVFVFILFIVAIVKYFSLKNKNKTAEKVVFPTSEERPINNYYVNNKASTYEDLFVEKEEELSPEEQQAKEEIPDLGIFNQSADMLVQTNNNDTNNTN